MEYQGLNFGIIMNRVHILYKKKGLSDFHDIWDPGRNNSLGWDEACMKFSLVEVYHDF